MKAKPTITPVPDHHRNSKVMFFKFSDDPELIRKHKISGSEQNQRINAIKFCYEKVLGRGKKSDTLTLRELKKSYQRITPHMLLHSFATHLLEQETDLRYIQPSSGHSSTKTTEIDTHISTQEINKIINPPDQLWDSS